MANRKKLKCLRKNRHKSKAGNRRRNRQKKSVVEKRRLRILDSDNLLNENFQMQQLKGGYQGYESMGG